MYEEALTQAPCNRNRKPLLNIIYYTLNTPTVGMGNGITEMNLLACGYTRSQLQSYWSSVRSLKSSFLAFHHKSIESQWESMFSSCKRNLGSGFFCKQIEASAFSFCDWHWALLMFINICMKMSLWDNQILFLASNRCSGLCGLITRMIVCWKHSSISVFSFKGQLHNFHFQPFSTLLIFMSFHEEHCTLPAEIKAKTWKRRKIGSFS